MRLTLLHFNDVHGRLEQLPRLASLIQQQRAAALSAGRRVLILDAGDSSDRNAWESDLTKGRANFALLDALGVQASVVGNGEALQWGRTALEKLVATAHFPLLAANLVDCADPSRLAVPGLRASCCFDSDGFKIGLTGATAQFGSGYTRFGYDAVPPVPVIQREAAALKAQGAKTVILLSHLGSWLHDPATKTPGYLNDEDLPAQIPELDVIIGGHTHIRLDPPVRVGNAVIAQAGDYGRWLGRVDLELDDETGRVRDFSGTLLPCDDTTPIDPTLSATLELVREEAARLLEARVAVTTQDWPHALDAPSPYAQLVADALRDICQADLAIFFSGFVRRGLNAGPITRRDLYESLSTTVHVTAAEVSGAQIRRMLNQMLASKWRTESFSPHRGEPPLGLPACSNNVSLHIDLNRPAGDQLVECRIGGVSLDPERRYRLASTFTTLNDISDDPEYDFVRLEPGQRLEMVRVEDVLWEIVEDWMKRRGTIGGGDAMRPS